MSLEKVAGSGGVQIAIERTGSGKPLLAIHGTASGRKRWFLTAAALGEGRELILMDRRARGDSSDGPPPYAIEQEFDDVAAVVAYIGKPLDVLGHSYGALLAIGAAPKLRNVDRIVLYEPPLRPIAADNDLPEQIEACVAKGDLEGGLRTFLTHVGATDADFARLRELPNWKERLTIVPTIPREVRAARGLSFSKEHLAAIKAPILLQLGSDSPPHFPRAIDELMQGLPNARREILPGQKHQAMDTAPALFVKSVRTFLDGTT
jgi:pimeloyl-ACP methyl ester carboxylesterase